MLSSQHAPPAPIDMRANVNIHEHRAPTDESVKILREMESAAKQEIIKSVQVKDTLVDGVLHMSLDPLSCKRRFMFIYSINGKKMTTNFDIDEWDYEKSKDWIGKLVETVSYDIAREIMMKPFIEMFKKGF